MLIEKAHGMSMHDNKLKKKTKCMKTFVME